MSGTAHDVSVLRGRAMLLRASRRPSDQAQAAELEAEASRIAGELSAAAEAEAAKVTVASVEYRMSGLVQEHLAAREKAEAELEQAREALEDERGARKAAEAELSRLRARRPAAAAAAAAAPAPQKPAPGKPKSKASVRTSRGLPHLLSLVFDRPLLVTADKARVIADVLAAQMRAPRTGMIDVRETEEASAEPARAYRLTKGGVAVLPIVGTLVQRTLFESELDALSGLVAYSTIAHDLDQALADRDVRGVVLELDSPGGECGGCFELVDRIAAARSRKPIYAVANAMACSAAYAIASAATRIYAPAVSYVGSIGVVVMHRDQSQADAAEGLRYTTIYAGARKNDGDPHAPLTDAARAAIQERIDGIYGVFVRTVAKNRSISEDRVRATQAGVFLAEEGRKAGLVDRVGTLDQATADLEREVAGRP